MTRLTHETAAAVLAIRELLTAIAQARPDGADLMETFAGGRIRVVLDEQEALITVGTATAPGESLTLLESVRCDPGDEATFGSLLSSRLREATPTTH